MKIKVGDRVRVVRSHVICIPDGSVCVVKDANCEDGFVKAACPDYRRNPDYAWTFAVEDLEIITETPTTYTRILEAIAGPEAVTMARNISEALDAQ